LGGKYTKDQALKALYVELRQKPIKPKFNLHPGYIIAREAHLLP
jgi:hypothetical protein